MIKVQGLGKSFDRGLVVRNLSFQASDGAITGLLGSNGAGKTTTLRMICGVLKPDSGSIFIDDASDHPLARQQRVGALLDHTGIYSRLTVRENLAGQNKKISVILRAVTELMKDADSPPKPQTGNA